MPFPLSFRGDFEYPSLGEPRVSATVVADRIERALRGLGARQLERGATSLSFTGPSAWTAARTNTLLILSRADVAIDPPTASGTRGRVRYALPTTKGLGVLVGLSTAIELYIRAVGDSRLPPLAFPGVLLGVWAIAYVDAWLRVPLLLMRAAAGELEPSAAATSAAAHRDSAT